MACPRRVWQSWDFEPRSPESNAMTTRPSCPWAVCSVLWVGVADYATDSMSLWMGYLPRRMFCPDSAELTIDLRNPAFGGSCDLWWLTFPLSWSPELLWSVQCLSCMKDTGLHNVLEPNIHTTPPLCGKPSCLLDWSLVLCLKSECSGFFFQLLSFLCLEWEWAGWSGWIFQHTKWT